MVRRATEVSGFPGAAVMGLALAGALAIRPEGLAAGGLAPVAVTAITAAFLAVPLAMVEWREGRLRGDGPMRGRRAAAEAVGELWALLLIGAAAAPWLPAQTLPAVAALWLAAALTAIIGGRAIVVTAAGLAVLAALTVAASGWMLAPPWTLLQPHWSSWSEWMPGAVIGGFVIAAGGFGAWAAHSGQRPGRYNLPWGVAGLALLTAVLFAVRHGAWYEATAGTGATDRGVDVVVLACLVAGCMGVLLPWRAPRDVAPRAALGAGAMWWFAGPGHDTLPAFWGTLLPLGLAFGAAVRAASSEGAARAIAGGCAAALTLAAVAGWPGLPTRMGGAAGVALLLVAAVWLGGTRAVLARST